MTVPEGATKFALHEPYVPASGTKIALHTPPHCTCGIKLALLARNGPFWRVSCVQGELCTALATNNPSRANFVPHTRWMRSQSTQPHTKCHRYGGCRRDRRARPRCPWAVAGPGCGARGRRRGLAGPRDDAPSHTSATRHHWCGGCRRARRARAGFEIDHSEPLGSRVAISRAAGASGAWNTSGATSNAGDQAGPQPQQAAPRAAAAQ